jgi:hypothetical protein
MVLWELLRWFFVKEKGREISGPERRRCDGNCCDSFCEDLASGLRSGDVGKAMEAVAIVAFAWKGAIIKMEMCMLNAWI